MARLTRHEQFEKMMMELQAKKQSGVKIPEVGAGSGVGASGGSAGSGATGPSGMS